MNRQQISLKIQENQNKIDALNLKNLELKRQSMILCDDKQQYEETEDTRLGSVHRGKIIGRVFWTEKFLDESSGKHVHVERTKIVKINGEWVA